MICKKPYSDGWEKLSIEERIENWLKTNEEKLGERSDDFRNFLLNFDASYPRLNSDSLKQLLFDLREHEDPSLEFWTQEEKGLLVDGVFVMYNTTPALLGLKLFNDKRESYKYN